MNARRIAVATCRAAGLLLRLTATCALAATVEAASSARLPAEREYNAWPFLVEQHDASGRIQRWQAAGPLVFKQGAADVDGNTARGFRPFWVQFETPDGKFRSGHVLYPLFNYSVDENTYKWSLLELVRRWDRRADASAPQTIFDQRGEFEIFPLWFSRQSGDPELSYRALFPIHGTIKNKLFFERLSWTLFPLYVQNEKRGVVTTHAPWPIVRVTRGAAQGWGVWPLYTKVERPGVSRHETLLWPLGFNSTQQAPTDAPPGTPPRRDVGLLPFYARSTGPGYINEDFLWPFFGYTDRASPQQYNERRYFWPFLVQGHGDQRTVNRWAPFYTHSIKDGYEKEWYMWPLVRRAQWGDQGVERKRTQFLYFLYWNEEQRLAHRPTAPAAELTHVWPLFSTWNNGAGRQQWQVLSPFEVFFGGNDKVRQTWSPLVALARHERGAPGTRRTSLLWNAISWEKRAAEESSEFHLGPLFSMARQADERRVAIGNGLFGLKRAAAGGGWKLFWLEFRPKGANVAGADATKAPPTAHVEGTPATGRPAPPTDQ